MDNYQKDFQGWSKVKQNLQNRESRIECKVGAVYWASIGVNVGSEQDGKGSEYTRPVLIIAKLGERLALMIPTTSRIRYGKYHRQILVSGKLHSLLLNQMRALDIKRLGNFIDEVPEVQIKKIKSALANLILE